MFDFDREIDRRFQDSNKWNKYPHDDILPMWVADMDFTSPPEVIEALVKRAQHGVFGYAEPTPGLVEAVRTHLQEDFGWCIAPEWLVWLPGLVVGINASCRTIGQRGDSVITATPIYPPFRTAPALSQRRLIEVPLRETDGRWTWDLAAAEAALTADTRLLLLCHPHNPMGIVWSDAELEAIAAFCEKHDLLICSDEIHAGLLLEEGARHRPIATLSERIAARSITLMAPSKTFNIAGLGCSFAVIPDTDLRSRFKKTIKGIVPDVNIMGFVATEAAYRFGKAWQEALLRYLRGNRDLLVQAISAIPGLKIVKPQATYLAWIDARGLGVADPVAFFEAAGVGLSNGADFGAPGFVRLNFGCTRATLNEAIRRIFQATGYR